MRWSKSIVAVALAALLIGCSKTANPPPEPPVTGPGGEEMEYIVPVAPAGTAKVSGKVTVGGKPVTAGRVLFQYDAGLALAPGIIAPNGSYEIEGLPTGAATVLVLLDPQGEMPFPTPPAGMGGGMGGGMAPPPGPPRVGGGPPGPPPGAPPMSAPGAPPPMMPSGGLLPLPEPFLQALGGYAIPPDQMKLYQALHVKYSRPSKANIIRTTIGEGSNSFDIKLTP